jgi:hypothetical protein
MLTISLPKSPKITHCTYHNMDMDVIILRAGIKNVIWGTQKNILKLFAYNLVIEGPKHWGWNKYNQNSQKLLHILDKILVVLVICQIEPVICTLGFRRTFLSSSVLINMKGEIWSIRQPNTHKLFDVTTYEYTTNRFSVYIFLRNLDLIEGFSSHKNDYEGYKLRLSFTTDIFNFKLIQYFSARKLERYAYQLRESLK